MQPFQAQRVNHTHDPSRPTSSPFYIDDETLKMISGTGNYNTGMYMRLFSLFHDIQTPDRYLVPLFYGHNTCILRLEFLRDVIHRKNYGKFKTNQFSCIIIMMY